MCISPHQLQHKIDNPATLMNNVLQALIYFFKNVELNRPLKKLDKKTLVAELTQFGVSLADLEKTFANIALWVASQSAAIAVATPSGQPQTKLSNYPVQPHAGTRIFTMDETGRISRKSRGFLTKLEQMGVLSPQMREAVIEQLLQADTHEEQEVRLSHTKWITFQTLFQDAPAVHVAYLEWLLFGKAVEAH